MSPEDLEKVAVWFRGEIAFLEGMPIYPEIRERVEALKRDLEEMGLVEQGA